MNSDRANEIVGMIVVVLIIVFCVYKLFSWTSHQSDYQRCANSVVFTDHFCEQFQSVKP